MRNKGFLCRTGTATENSAKKAGRTTQGHTGTLVPHNAFDFQAVLVTEFLKKPIN